MTQDTRSLAPRESHPARVAPRIAAIRSVLGLTQTQLAEIIGLDRSTMSKVERGEKGLAIQHGETLAQLYGFGLDFIYRGDLNDIPLDYRPTVAAALNATGTTD
ncbi:helix-turn-helix transcriptional regulator [Shimia ponticola]|uniref:helix-turn-helix transcriptional regulator n=1 Tax=Shimia ponticola TaxID=2582893 RepID=UPI0011BFB502|nr:helix-turn-helix transcriptional regulator [Shimia ponticola]